MNLNRITEPERMAYIEKAIMIELQEAGGQISREDLKSRICEKDDVIADYASQVSVSKKSGNQYKKFNFKFNFAIKELSFVDLLIYVKRNPMITLTEKGLGVDLETFDVMKDVHQACIPKWRELSGTRKKDEGNEEEIIESEVGLESKYNEDFKERLLNAIAKMTPKKFESFSRLLLGKMGISFTQEGTQISNDGGIDGFGYHFDKSDFRTSKVVIQCKRYNSAPVSEPQINEFLGAMNKFRADYGVFVTNSRFTKAARDSARQGQPITLIDGDALVELVKEYKVHVNPITTYELDLDYYNEE